MKLSSFVVISLLLVFNARCYKILGLYEVTEDAIRVGNKLQNLECVGTGKTNITVVGLAAMDYLKLFNDRYNEGKPIPAFDTKLIFNLFIEVNHTSYLNDNLQKFGDFYIKSLPIIVKSMMTSGNENLFKPKSEYLNEDINFANENDDRPFATKLNDLHNLLLEKDEFTRNSIFDIIIQETGKSKCRSLTIQTLFYLLDYITLSDAFGYVLMQFYYAAYKLHKETEFNDESVNAIEESWSEKDVNKKTRDLEKAFIKRNSDTLKLFREAIAALPREARYCYDESVPQFHPPLSVDLTTTKLENLFQKYIINEVDLNEDGTCTRECGDYRKTLQNGCFDKGLCARQRSCDGILWDCNAWTDEKTDIYLEYDPHSNARYSSIVVSPREIPSYFDSYYRVSFESWRRGFVKCTYCSCTCEERNAASDRYFNLKPVLSDVNANYVIVNVKLTKVNHVIHIQVQEGQLLQEGRMNITSVRWKPVDNYTTCSESVKDKVDYHTISYKQRTVLIDQIDAPLNYALTGLKFTSDNGNLKLEIHATPFDFTTGQLNEKDSRWISRNTKFSDRHEEKFKNKDDLNAKPNRYIRFANDINIRAGQTTIPYIENREVIQLFQPLVLSGAGLITKSTEGAGSILGLQLITYNYGFYLPVPNDNFQTKY